MEVAAEVAVVTAEVVVIEAAADPGVEAVTGNVDDEARPGLHRGQTPVEGPTRENETKSAASRRSLGED